MASDLDAIIARIRAAERELEEEFAKQRAKLGFGLERGRAVFEAEIVRRHKEMRRHIAKYILTARPLVVITAPVIYSLIIPFVILDIWVSLYQAICFRVYGIQQVKRGKYLIFDRSALQYLNALEKLNCAYCSYCNGVAAYVREVAARTEQYWCPIKHAKRVVGAHPRYALFQDYGDGEHYRERVKLLREQLRERQNDDPEAEPAEETKRA
jgi:hypothetical protein